MLAQYFIDREWPFVGFDAQRTDRPAATNVAALAQISFVSFLLGSPLLGFVAEHPGIRWTFGLLLSVAVSSILRAEAASASTHAVR